MFLSNCTTSLWHKSTSRGFFSSILLSFELYPIVYLKRGHSNIFILLACLLCKVIMTRFIFLPPVYWERVAYLHVNSSHSPAASLKVVNGATCKGGGGGVGGCAVWGAREVHSCFLWCSEEKLVSLILWIHGDRERAVAKRTQANQLRSKISVAVLWFLSDIFLFMLLITYSGMNVEMNHVISHKISFYTTN